MHKHLTVEYEIVGTGGSLHSYEMDGRLLETLHASALPVVAPQVVILAATYGYTAELIAERKRVLTKELYELQAIRHRRVCGLTVSREQNKRLRKMPELQQRLKRLATIRPGSTDVLDVVQRRIETHGGGNLTTAVYYGTSNSDFHSICAPSDRRQLDCGGLLWYRRAHSLSYDYHYEL